MSLPKRSKSPETVSMISSELSKSVSNNSKKMNKKRSMSADKLGRSQMNHHPKKSLAVRKIQVATILIL